MAQHYTINTKQVLHYCPTCNRNTMHRVDFKRLGSCIEHVKEVSLSQVSQAERRELLAMQPGLF